jgi:hypothetical protein
MRSSLVMVIVRCEMQIERENPLRAESVQKLPFCPAQNIKFCEIKALASRDVPSQSRD